MSQVEAWAEISNDVFESKWLLLKAEHDLSRASNRHDLQYSSLLSTEKFYLSSITVALGNGSIHEAALAYEFLANFYSTVKREVDATCCYEKAYIYYRQWGAFNVAAMIAKTHNLDTVKVVEEMQDIGSSKHSREWEDDETSSEFGSKTSDYLPS